MKIITTSSILMFAMAISVHAEERVRPERDRPERGEGRMEDGRGKEGRGKEGRRGRHMGPPDEMFRKLDKDSDGKITREEFFAAPRMVSLPEEKRALIFERIDGNEDGVITQEEIFNMRADPKRRAMGDFRKLDVDGSGGLTYEEFSQGEFFSKIPEERRRKMFERMDTDGSGEITAEDRPKGPPRRRPERPGPKPEKPE